MNAASFLTFAEAWRTLGPEITLTFFAFVTMVVEFILPPGKKKVTPWLAVLGVIVALAVAITRLGVSSTAYSLSVVAVDDFATIFQILILGSVGLILLLAIGIKEDEQMPYEYSYLLLFATVGALVMAAATDLITLYVGLELLSITSYVLVGLLRHSAKSAEGSLKYLIIGSIASALILYGLSFIYGVAGSTQLTTIVTSLQTGWSNEPGILFVSLALVVAGVGIKVSAVPFHLWTADVYEGAPTPVTTFLAVVAKVGVFAFLLRIFIFMYGLKMSQWYDIIAWIAVITMVVGNVGALTQKNVKRLLAYSSIAQAGYVLVPVAAMGAVSSESAIYQGLSSIVFYLTAYALMTIGAFTVYSVVADARLSSHVDAFNGLYRRSPWLASAMAVFLLSLAGIPLTAGFFGKFLIFLVAFNTGQYWLGVILFATSVVAFYYYFGILRAMFTREPIGDRDAIRGNSVIQVVVTLCVVGTVWFGVYPTTLMNVLNGLHWFG